MRALMLCCLLGRGAILAEEDASSNLRIEHVRRYYAKQQVRVDLAVSDGIAVPVGPVEVRLIGTADSRVLRTIRLDQWQNRRVSGAISTEGAEPGLCILRAALLDAQGAEIGQAATASLEWPPKPSWYGSAIGVSDAVLPPWTPLEIHEAADEITINMWGREYRFDTHPLPSQIRTGGRDILSRPSRIVATVDGQAVRWRPESMNIQKATPAAMGITHELSCEKLTLRSTVLVEFDGLIRVDWTVEPHGLVKLDGLMLEIPIRRQYARYLHVFPDYHTRWENHKPGLVENSIRSKPLKANDDRVMGFSPTVWLGDEQCGLQWVCESDMNWFNTDSSSAIEVARDGEETILRIHLVGGKPIAMQPGGAQSRGVQEADPNAGPLGKLAYTFGLMATPVKPIAQDAWDYRTVAIDRATTLWHAVNDPHYGHLQTGFDGKSNLDYLADCGVRTIILFDGWTHINGYVATKYEGELHSFVRACHDRDMQLLLYFGYFSHVRAPEAQQFGDEWTVVPTGAPTVHAQAPDAESDDGTFYTSQQSSWQDLVVWGIDRLIQDYDIDGVYLDGTASATRAGDYNIHHGGGYWRASRGSPEHWFDAAHRADPSARYCNAEGIQATFPLFATRDMLRRIYTVVRTRKPQGQVVSHSSGYMIMPALAWATSYWDGETLSGMPYAFPLDRISLDQFRAEHMGRQWGLPAFFLHRFVTSYDQSFSFCLLHDVYAMPGQDKDSVLLASRFWNLFERFGRRDAQWVPYWRNEEFLRSAKDIYVSIYPHPSHGVLAIVCNLDREARNTWVQFDLAKLGLAGREIRAWDVENQRSHRREEPLPMRDGRIAFTQGSLDWKIIWLRPERAAQ